MSMQNIQTSMITAREQDSEHESAGKYLTLNSLRIAQFVFSSMTLQLFRRNIPVQPLFKVRRNGNLIFYLSTIIADLSAKN